jgi:ferritin-like metal-binding protein YciE
MFLQNQYIVSQLKYLIDHATTPEGKAKLEQQLRETEQHIKEMIDMGIKTPKTTQESRPT